MIKFLYYGKIVGGYDENTQTYITARNSVLHYYCKMGGYPISVSILKKLSSLGCKFIIIIEQKPDKRYKSYLCDLKDYLKEETFKFNNYDEQKCYPLIKMLNSENINLLG